MRKVWLIHVTGDVLSVRPFYVPESGLPVAFCEDPYLLGCCNSREQALEIISEHLESINHTVD